MFSEYLISPGALSRFSRIRSGGRILNAQQWCMVHGGGDVICVWVAIGASDHRFESSWFLPARRWLRTTATLFRRPNTVTAT